MPVTQRKTQPPKGARTRASILDRAVDLASVEGLEGHGRSAAIRFRDGRGGDDE